MTFQRVILLLAALPALAGCAHRLVVEKPPVAGIHRERILILTGLGYSLEKPDDMKKFAAQLSAAGYDVYVPDYIRRKGMDASVDALGKFIRERGLDRGEKVHVLAYIIGGATLDLYLQKHDLPTLASVIYDRSPLQERAPAIVASQMPFVGHVLFGHVIFDFAKTKYPPLARTDIPIGIVVENRATHLIRKYEKQTLAMGPVTFDVEQFGQPHVAVCWVWLDHTQMYHHFEVIGPEVLEFLRDGHFTEDARAQPFEKDPFRD